jgi:uncharacterized membrane protein
MLGFSNLDYLAFGFFALCWLGYVVAMESRHGQESLNSRMNSYREVWMERLLARDVRIVDTQILAALHNGTAFFASTTLIAIGGALTLLRSTDDVLAVLSALPTGAPASRAAWEIKTIGLTMIFVYAFFKFAWSYRLFNYVAILVGGMPPPEEKDTPQAKEHMMRTTRLFQSAGLHFNRGQRAFFFALGFLGWFVGAPMLFASTTAIVVVMWRRQFASEAAAAIRD